MIIAQQQVSPTQRMLFTRFSMQYNHCREIITRGTKSNLNILILDNVFDKLRLSTKTKISTGTKHEQQAGE